MFFAAFASVKHAALGKIAFLECQLRAHVVPADRTTDWVKVNANARAALRIVAARRNAWAEATARSLNAATNSAALFGQTDAVAIPYKAAAVRVDVADRVAAGRVIAVGRAVGVQAVTRAQVAAGIARATNLIGQNRAHFVPFHFAAVRVVWFAIAIAVIATDRGATRFGFATGGVLGQEASAFARAVVFVRTQAILDR